MNCFMIMAHKNPEQIVRLARAVHTNETDVVIHVDIRIKEDDYRYVTESLENIAYFTDQRFPGALDDRSLVDITLEMLHKSKKIENMTGKHYAYFALLSGQDYPIKSMDYIECELKKMYPVPLIDCTPYAKSNWVFHKFNESKNSLKYHKWIRKLPSRYLRAPFVISEMLIHKFGWIDTSKKRLDQLGIDIYGGSMWWILPDQIVDFILEEMEKQKADSYLSLLLDECFTPDETFFQIMAMRSDLKSLVQMNPVDQVTQNCKTWAYFSDEDKPFKGHPYIFTEKEYPKLCASDRWFARKFDITVDSRIFDLLDNKIRKEKAGV